MTVHIKRLAQAIFNNTWLASRLGFRLGFLLLAMSLAACTEQTSGPQISPEDIAENNRGVALMGRFDYPAATDLFANLLERKPDWHELRINYAVALKNRQQPEDAQAAIDQLKLVLAEEPDNLRANYVAGVLHLYLGDIEPAAKHFQAALAVDNYDAYSHYYLGQCQLRSGDTEGALASYQQAIELDPYLRSAYYSAAQVLRRLKRNEEAGEQLRLFQRFENNPSARLAEFKYTRMGPQSLAKVLGDAGDAQAVELPEGPIFDEPNTIASFHGLSETVGADASFSTVDINHDGYQDLFISGDIGGQVLRADASGSLSLAESQPWGAVSDIAAVAWGDVDNNGLVDAYLCRTGINQLWMQTAEGWSQTETAAGVDDGEQNCSDAVLVDADHDGDLDILIANKGAGDSLLNNNRDGSFRSLSEKLLDAATAADTRHLLTTDLDADTDVDLIFVRDGAPNVVLINDRQWNYVAAEGLDEFIASDITAAAANDVDADGYVELFGINAEGAVTQWQSDISGAWQSQQIYQSQLANGNTDLLPMDVNGNGRAELLLLAKGGFEVLTLVEDGTASQAASQQFSGSAPRPVIRTMRGSSLLALNADAESVDVQEWAPGTGRFDFVTLVLSGKHDAAETMRSNGSGIGSRVSVRTGTRWSINDTHKHASISGYSLQPLTIGLGGQQQADFVAVDWSDGVYQTELDVASGAIQTIAEEQRQLGSCPVLFAWNGEKFDFVTDILGVGAQGFLVEPGTLLPPRPWEYVTFAPGALSSRDGRIMFKVTEPMEENSYIDAMTLRAYDVPDDWDLVVDERMGTGEPEVTGATMYYQQAISPARAYDSQGKDVHAAILQADQQAMEPGIIDRRYIGLLENMESVTLEFDQPIDQLNNHPAAVPVLWADSWVELPYSQTHFAAWQAGKAFRSVTLEARVADQEWQMVYPDFGIPAGMPRVMSLPMETLPEGTTALRLSWNRQIYWDRIRVVFAQTPEEEIIPQEISPQLARVAKSGFYERLNHAQRRPEYVYQQRRVFGDVKYPTGMYTSLGEMTELVSTADDALAIIGPGEEIHVEFAEPKPPEAGHQRWYVLETRGWAKDKDLYTYQGNTVGPLPRAYPEADAQTRDALHEKYNTRFQSGR